MKMWKPRELIEEDLCLFVSVVCKTGPGHSALGWGDTDPGSGRGHWMPDSALGGG